MVEPRPPAEEHRRLAELERRSAVAEQVAADIAKTLARLEANLDRLDTAVDGFIQRADARSAEAAGSPAGRSLLTRFDSDESIISAHGHRLEELEDWRNELRGAFAITRFAFGTSIVAAIVATLAIVESVRH